MALPDGDRQRVIDEEEYRLHVRAALAQRDSRPAVVRWLSSEHIRWIITALIIPVTAAVWGYFSSKNAERERGERETAAKAERDLREDAERQVRNLDLVVKLLPGLNAERESPARNNAFTVMKHLELVGKLPPTLREAMDIEAQSLSPKVDPQTNTYRTPQALSTGELLGKGAPNSKELESGVPPSFSYTVPGAKVYIQIFDSVRQMGSAERVQQVAREMGIAAPGIENVVAVARRKNSQPPQGYGENVIVAFKKEDLLTAKELADRVKQKTELTLKVVDRTNTKLSARVPAGQMEVWFDDLKN